MFKIKKNEISNIANILTDENTLCEKENSNENIFSNCTFNTMINNNIFINEIDILKKLKGE